LGTLIQLIPERSIGYLMPNDSVMRVFIGSLLYRAFQVSIIVSIWTEDDTRKSPKYYPRYGVLSTRLARFVRIEGAGAKHPGFSLASERVVPPPASSIEKIGIC
jgi:hypothetical protein